MQNILINACLLKLIHSTTKNKTTFFKIFLASLVGSISSVLVITFIENNFILNITKFITAFFMILIAFKQSKKQIISNIILLYLYTYAFGGLVTSFNSQTYHTEFGIITSSKISLELICSLILISTFIFDMVLKHIKFKIKTNSLIYKISLTQNNNTININAYLDTGNFLNHNGKPILLLDINSYLKLTKSNLISFYTSNTETIKTSTVTGNNKLKIFCVDKIQIKNKKSRIELKNQLVAINTTNCFKNANYQALLSPLFL